MKKIIEYFTIIFVLLFVFTIKVNALFKDVDYASNNQYKVLCQYNLMYDKSYVVTIYEKLGQSGIFAVSYIEDGEEKGLEGTTSEINSTGNFSNTKSMVNVKAMGCPSGAYIDKSAVGWDEICFSTNYGPTKKADRVSSNCLIENNIGTYYQTDFQSSRLVTDNVNANSSGESGNSDVDLGEFTGNSDCYGFLGDKNTVGTPAYYLHMALNIIRYAAIVVALVLSIIDFFKAIYSQDKDLLKKASMTTVKRLVFAVVIFFIPTVLEFILKLLGAYTIKCV